ncbi:hypothetical protein ABEB36_002909 [Hypothenemus hampei]|uniref:Uncharacterized protein n=1 Tax=Hypothenemus hampei TaxID=57062 RepID=A0ABD1F7F6_HYPHA
MQFVQNIMDNYIFKSLIIDKGTTNTKLNLSNKNHVDHQQGGSGDFSLGKAKEMNFSEKNFNKQLQNAKTLVRSLEDEIAESKLDICYLHDHIYQAEETFPKRWETYNKLKDLYKKHTEALSMELKKWKRRNERFDKEMIELEQRIGSWQCIIERAKEMQIQEEYMFE